MPLIVTKKQKESTGAFLRRFSRVVQQSGLLVRARSLQYRKRPKTERIDKKNALHRMHRRREMDHLRKLGKIE
jgi:ribosomal protein S21